MLRRLIEVRMLMALAIAAGVGIGGLRAFPIRSDQVFLAVIEARLGQCEGRRGQELAETAGGRHRARGSRYTEGWPHPL